MVAHYLQYILLRFVLMLVQSMSIERCDRLARVLAAICLDGFRCEENWSTPTSS